MLLGHLVFIRFRIAFPNFLLTEASPRALVIIPKELKALEMNKLVTRTMYNSMPVTIEYSLISLGESTTKLINELLEWGLHFRKEVLSK